MNNLSGRFADVVIALTLLACVLIVLGYVFFGTGVCQAW